jgi:hypothetical protein
MNNLLPTRNTFNVRYFLRLLFIKSQFLIDLCLSFAIIPSAYLLLFYRKIGSSRLPKTTLRLKNIGIFPIQNHYYEPLFDDRQLSSPLHSERSLPGINLNINFQLNFLTFLSKRDELIRLDLYRASNNIDSFCINNGSFESGDAEFLYQFIRHIKPKKIIEIGSGNSTKISHMATDKNRSESKHECVHICYEPYEQQWLSSRPGITVRRELIEKSNIDWANELSAGDLLFIDSSHIIRPQGDVLMEYLEILPQLKAGVYIHVHDIFTPRDYPKSWVVDDVRFWNEQYLLEVLLSNTNRYEIVASLNFLKNNYYVELKSVCPYLTEDREPGSFYFKIRSG